MYREDLFGGYGSSLAIVVHLEGFVLLIKDSYYYDYNLSSKGLGNRIDLRIGYNNNNLLLIQGNGGALRFDHLEFHENADDKEENIQDEEIYSILP